MRKNMKKLIAVSMSSLLAAGLIAGNVEYASHTFALTGGVAQAVAVEAQTTTREESKANASGGLESDSKVSKQETVYVNMDANGERKDVVVSDWLKNSGTNGSLEDVSSLTDIQNVKGEETFAQDGKKLTWQTEGQDIYYQGKTDKELPVGMEITYKLDGKKVSPEDIVGKDGKLEINIKYTNTSKKKVTVGGEQVDIYIPFMMATGMILPVEQFKNITIDNGTIVSEGDNDIVVGFGMPGLSESLELEQLDFGQDMDIDSSKIRDKITDTVKITADVTDFEMKSTYTVATNQLFNELDFDDIDDLDELNRKMDTLRESSEQLVDGSGDLQEGTRKLKDSFKKYADGIHKVRDGAGELKKGSSDLKSGVNTYTRGADKLLSGVDTFVSSVNTLLSKDNMDTMEKGTADLKKGIGQLDDGLTAAQSGVAAINETVGKLKKTEETEACVSGLNQMIEQYAAAAKQYESAGDEASAKQYKDMAAVLTGAVTYIQGGEQIAAGIEAATNGKADGDADKNGAGDLAVALSTMKQATDQKSKETNLYTGAASLETAAGTMSGYAAQLRDNSSQITKNAKKLTKNSGSLRSGTKTLAKGADALFDGMKKLETSTGDVSDGIADLNRGARDLSDGMSRFHRDGIVKTTDAVTELLDAAGSFNERLSRISAASNGYTTFSGAAKSMDGSVKFLMATEEVTSGND